MGDLWFRYALLNFSTKGSSGKLLVKWSRTAEISLGTLDTICKRFPNCDFFGKSEEKLIRIILDRIIDYCTNPYLIVYRLLLFGCETYLLIASQQTKIYLRGTLPEATRKQVEFFLDPSKTWDHRPSRTNLFIQTLRRDAELVDEMERRRSLLDKRKERNERILNSEW